jgi:hypothetical protein
MSDSTHESNSREYLLSLKTLAVDFEHSEDDTELFEYCLTDVLRRCKAMDSLHLS